MTPPSDWSWRSTRRRLLNTAAGTLLGGTATAAARDEDGKRTESFVLTEEAVTEGYLYLPFYVPEGVQRIDLELSKSGGDASVGPGLFDHRGPQYQTDGHRGTYGTQKKTCYVAETDASRSFLPGRIEAGTWTAFVQVFSVTIPTTISITVTLTYGPRGRRQRRQRRRHSVPTVSPEPGWYCGDLHTHTKASSDAFATGSALSPRGWAAKADDLGLDFISLTDHNLITQNLERRSAMRNTDGDVLLIGGEEMTNPFHGHATVTGLEDDQWLDFRQRPRALPLGDYEARIQQFVRQTRELDTYTAIAHPMLALGDNNWDFFYEALSDPAARLDGMEVWNGPWTPDDEGTLRLWDRLLQRGWRITGSGGSDTHGTDDPTFGTLPGIPTTHVYASSLSTAGIVDGLRQGRAYLSHAPDGPDLLLAGRTEESSAMIGETLQAPIDASVTLEATVRDGAGYTLFFIRDGEPVKTERIEAAQTTVTTTQPMGAGGYVRLELRGQPDLRPETPYSSRGGMKALTNPVFLEPSDQQGLGTASSLESGVGGQTPAPQALVDDGLIDLPTSEPNTHSCPGCGWGH